MAQKQVRLWEMTRKEFCQLVETGTLKTAILPMGSTEQHLEHLAMINDTVSALHISEQAALRLYPRVVVATPLAIGVSEHWMVHKGTLTVCPDVFRELAFDVCRSLKRGGIEHILLLNGHAGNAGPISERFEDFTRDFGAEVRFISYWSLIPPSVIEKHMETRNVPSHGSEFETSILLAISPERVRIEDIEDEGAKLASAEKGRAMIKAAVQGVVAVLREMMTGSSDD